MTYIVCSYLQNRIKDFVASRGESFRWFARQTGVDYSTVYRLQAGEQRSLSFRNAVKILKVIDPQNFISILGEYYPFETRELSNATQEKVDELTTILAADISFYRLLIHAGVGNASRADIKEKFGTDGLDRVERLIECGVLSEVEGLLHDNLEGMTYPSEDIVKRISMHHFAMISLSTPGSILENFRGAVSEKGLREIYEASLEYRAKVHKTLDEEKGIIVVAGSLIAGPAE